MTKRECSTLPNNNVCADPFPASPWKHNYSDTYGQGNGSQKSRGGGGRGGRTRGRRRRKTCRAAWHIRETIDELENRRAERRGERQQARNNDSRASTCYRRLDNNSRRWRAEESERICPLCGRLSHSVVHACVALVALVHNLGEDYQNSMWYEQDRYSFWLLFVGGLISYMGYPEWVGFIVGSVFPCYFAWLHVYVLVKDCGQRITISWTM